MDKDSKGIFVRGYFCGGEEKYSRKDSKRYAQLLTVMDGKNVFDVMNFGESVDYRVGEVVELPVRVAVEEYRGQQIIKYAYREGNERDVFAEIIAAAGQSTGAKKRMS